MMMITLEQWRKIYLDSADTSPSLLLATLGLRPRWASEPSGIADACTCTSEQSALDVSVAVAQLLFAQRRDLVFALR
tara:strand:+ start:432 stop:662 length:231 start_codon:yes stop_codon:yes gene_type:complete